MSKRAERARTRETERRRTRIVVGGGIALIVALLVLAIANPSRENSALTAGTMTSLSQPRRISPIDAKEMMDGGEAMLYDVRERGFYDTKHAVGAAALPEAELDSLFDTLPKDKDLVLY